MFSKNNNKIISSFPIQIRVNFSSFLIDCKGSSWYVVTPFGLFIAGLIMMREREIERERERASERVSMREGGGGERDRQRGQNEHLNVPQGLRQRDLLARGGRARA